MRQPAASAPTGRRATGAAPAISESELDTVTQAPREGTLAPGKRLRPLLLLLALGDLDADPAIGLDPACALEMIHAASLFLDDMPCMDNASLRRGQPTIHLRFGEDVAVLASVALLSHAYGITAMAPSLSPRQRNDAVALLAGAVARRGWSAASSATCTAQGSRSSWMR